MNEIQSFPSNARPGINWPEQIKSWKQSGLSQASYCRREKISYSTFLYWRRRYENPKTSSSDISFVRLDSTVLNDSISLTNSVGPPGDTSSGIRIFFDPLSVSVSANFSPTTLSQVIRVLVSI